MHIWLYQASNTGTRLPDVMLGNNGCATPHHSYQLETTYGHHHNFRLGVVSVTAAYPRHIHDLSVHLVKSRERAPDTKLPFSPHGTRQVASLTPFYSRYSLGVEPRPLGHGPRCILAVVRAGVAAGQCIQGVRDGSDGYMAPPYSDQR